MEKTEIAAFSPSLVETIAKKFGGIVRPSFVAKELRRNKGSLLLTLRELERVAEISVQEDATTFSEDLITAMRLHFRNAIPREDVSEAMRLARGDVLLCMRILNEIDGKGGGGGGMTTASL